MKNLFILLVLLYNSGFLMAMAGDPMHDGADDDYASRVSPAQRALKAAILANDSVAVKAALAAGAEYNAAIGYEENLTHEDEFVPEGSLQDEYIVGNPLDDEEIKEESIREIYPLFFAISVGSYEALEAMLEAGADPHSMDPLTGLSLLNTAIGAGDENCEMVVRKHLAPKTAK